MTPEWRIGVVFVKRYYEKGDALDFDIHLDDNVTINSVRDPVTYV